MTRQILQTVATSRIPSACKMTRHLFQQNHTSYITPGMMPLIGESLDCNFIYFFFYQQLKALLEQYFFYFLLLLDIISPFELAYI